MTVDLSEFRALSMNSGKPCGVHTFLEGLSDREQAELRGAFADPTIEGAAIHRWMEKRGFELRANAVRVHRKGDCACERS